MLLQSCPTLCDPVHCSLPGSSVHGMLQARTLELTAMPSSRWSSQPRDRTRASYIYLHWQLDSLPLAPPAGVPNLWAVDQYVLWDLQWCQIRNKVHHKWKALESPQTIPHLWSIGKFSSMKLVPGTQKIGDLWFRELKIKFLWDKISSAIYSNFDKYDKMCVSSQYVFAL